MIPHNTLFFQHKVLVITGAAGQFGRAGCVYFAQRGAKIAALDLSASALVETVQQVSEQCGEDCADIKAFVCDQRDAAQVQSVIQDIVARFGRIDLLWNNAGYQGAITPTLSYDPNDFAQVMSVNVTGAFIMLQAVAQQICRQAEQDSTLHDTRPSYAIVNTASVAGLRGTPAMPAYVASKAAVLGLTSSVAKDLAPYNIRVNACSPALIGPGTMWTRQNELHAASGSPYFARDPDVVAQSKLAGVPLKRLGSVLEVLQAVAFLLSDQSSYMTGSNLVVDGGMASGLKA
jgi:NAD(P)-dependent dehydrogenase (short-subunit alcohol dehydrogenase family)